MTKIRKRRKPKHYTKDNGYCSKEDFLKQTRGIEYAPFCGDSLEHIFSSLEYEAQKKYKISSLEEVGVNPSSVCFDMRSAYNSWDDCPEAIFEVSVKIADMNQEAVDYLWSQQEKKNKKIVASYEKRFAKWKEWHDEFGEALAAQEKQKEENALKKEKAAAERALKAAQARLDKLKDKQ